MEQNKPPAIDCFDRWITLEQSIDPTCPFALQKLRQFATRVLSRLVSSHLISFFFHYFRQLKFVNGDRF